MNADRTTVARLCVQIFDRIQLHGDPEQQVLALAAAFLLAAEVARIPPQDAFVAVKNLMYDAIHADGRDHRFAAMKYHLEQDYAA